MGVVGKSLGLGDGQWVDGWRGGREDGRVEGAGAVEEFEVEGDGGLAVDFSVRGGLHCHFWGCCGWLGGGCEMGLP